MRDREMTRRLTLGALIAGCLWVILWIGGEDDSGVFGYRFRGQQADYYNLLVDGFQKSQLSLALTPAIFPAALEDGRVPLPALAPLDTSRYQERIYLYYGVVPAVLVLWPYSSLTGHDLSLNVPTVGFTVLGFLLSLSWLFRLRARWFPRSSLVADSAAILLLAFGPATLFLVRRSMFYELPLAAGYACFMGFLWAVTDCIRPGNSKPYRSLAVASACVGLAAGCHPNYAVLTILVALAALWIWADARRASRSISAIRLGLCAVIPAGLIGAGLATYNHARFDSWLEFGFNYGQNVFFTTSDQLISAAFIWPNFKWAFLTPPTLSPYFPFVYPLAAFRPPGYHGAEAIHGQFVVTLVLLWIVFGCWRWRDFWSRDSLRLALILGLSTVAAAGFIFLLGIRANRYHVDFQAPLVCLGALACIAVSNAAYGQRYRLIWYTGLTVLTSLMALANLGASLQLFDLFQHTRPANYLRWSKALNPSWSTWSRLGLVQTGTLSVDVVFAPTANAVMEPLITTGLPGYSDTLFVAQHPSGTIEVVADHFGYGGPRSQLIPYEPGHTYHFEIEMGSFLPPANDPFFAAFEGRAVNGSKSRVKVTIDGDKVLDQKMTFYESAPWVRDLGRNVYSQTPGKTHFSGRIRNPRWSPTPIATEESSATLSSDSVLRLELSIPPLPPRTGQPIIATGETGAGSLLFLQVRNTGQWQIQVDEWGHGLISAEPFAMEPGLHTLDLVIGPSLANDTSIPAAAKAPALPVVGKQIVASLDGKVIARLSLQQNLSLFKDAVIGTNSQGFSTAEPALAFDWERVALTAAEKEKLLQNALP